MSENGKEKYTAEHLYPKDDISYYGQSFIDEVHKVLNNILVDGIVLNEGQDIVVHFSDFYEQDTGDDVFISIRKDMTIEPLIRCKDCKYYLHSNEVCELVDTRLHFYETDKVWTEDCFCSWGERREDEQIH